MIKLSFSLETRLKHPVYASRRIRCRCWNVGAIYLSCLTRNRIRVDLRRDGDGSSADSCVSSVPINATDRREIIRVHFPISVFRLLRAVLSRFARRPDRPRSRFAYSTRSADSSAHASDCFFPTLTCTGYAQYFAISVGH